MNVSDHLIQRLSEWGVHRIFGYPGDGINGVMGALGRDDHGIAFVQARHEELAAFMACAHAKFTGTPGVCLATSGPGAIHLLNGLYDARMDHQPVVAIVGQQARSALGGEYQQEVDLANLFKDVAAEFVQTVAVPAQLRHVVDRALRIATERRTVTCIILPNDVQELDAVPMPPRAHGSVRSGIGTTRRAQVPDDTALDAAADILNAGRRVAMLVGAGALHATDEVMAVAERLGAGVAKALLGKAVLPDALPYVTGSIGLLGTAPSSELMEGCDTLLMVGSNFPYAEYLPEEGQARGVQIDTDAARLGLRYPMELNLVGDSRATLAALLPRLRQQTDLAWRAQIEDKVAHWWQVLEHRAMQDAKPINPQRVFWELSPRLPDGCLLTCDSGTAATWYARDVQLRRGMAGSLSGGLATMGPALPYALAAKHAYPDRPVVALLGDGAMQMLGINALITIAASWRHWSDPRLVVMVLNNGDLNMVSWEQRATAGDPKFSPSQDLPPFAYAEFARQLGLGGLRIDDPAQIGPAWEAAFAARMPMVLEMVTDPNVPPVPPHVTGAQMRSYLAALLKGDPDARQLILASAKDWWAGVSANFKGRRG